MGYVNKFNRGVARVQKELLENGNECADFTVDEVTVFSVNVTNAKTANVTTRGNDYDSSPNEKELLFSDKSLKILDLCLFRPYSKKEMLMMVGVTNQTANIRNIINPLIQAGCLAPIEEDKLKSRNVRYETTARGLECLKSQQSK